MCVQILIELQYTMFNVKILLFINHRKDNMKTEIRYVCPYTQATEELKTFTM